MEENNRPAPANGESAQNENRGSHGHGHRGHRGGRRHGGDARQNRENAAVNIGAPQESPAPANNAPVNNAPAENPNNAAQNAQNGDRNGRRRHRGGRGHGGNGGNGQNAPQEQQNQTAQNGGKNTNNAQTASGTKQSGGNDRNRRRDRRDGRNPRQDSMRRGDEIYGDPQAEKELAELRAKIVLKSADGSAPVAPAPQAPAAPVMQSASFQPIPSAQTDALRDERKSASDEPVELPEDIDLLHSDILDPPQKDTEGLVEVVGIRFRAGGKMYYFDPTGKKLRVGDLAVMETARGPEFGEVCLANTFVKINTEVQPLRPILRKATAEDIAHNEENRRREAEALPICQKKIEEHGLDMKLVDVQYIFDNSRLLFYFSSEGRVDFRELVRDLASVFHTRIELRQIGIRDEAKMLGGIGACGRALCCSTFLPDFAQVSIKMAKEQNLSLNSVKISGLCGRLMCCLHYEADTYAAEIRLTPQNDAQVRTPDGIGTVIGSNPLAGTVRVLIKEADSENTTVKQFHRSEVTVLAKERKDQNRGDKPVKTAPDAPTTPAQAEAAPEVAPEAVQDSVADTSAAE